MDGSAFDGMISCLIIIGILIGLVVAGCIWLLVWLWPVIKAWLHAVTA